MLEHSQREHLEMVIGKIEVFATTFQTDGEAAKLMALVENLRSFAGGPWFSVYCDMMEESNIFLDMKFNALMLREVDTLTGDPEQFFEAIVKDSDLPIFNPRGTVI